MYIYMHVNGVFLKETLLCAFTNEFVHNLEEIKIALVKRNLFVSVVSLSVCFSERNIKLKPTPMFMDLLLLYYFLLSKIKYENVIIVLVKSSHICL